LSTDGAAGGLKREAEEPISLKEGWWEGFEQPLQAEEDFLARIIVQIHAARALGLVPHFINVNRAAIRFIAVYPNAHYISLLDVPIRLLPKNNLAHCTEEPYFAVCAHGKEASWCPAIGKEIQEKSTRICNIKA
jgi:hypothetical protein